MYGGGKDLEGNVDPAGRKRGLEMTFFVLDREHWADDALLSEYVVFSDIVCGQRDLTHTLQGNLWTFFADFASRRC